MGSGCRTTAVSGPSLLLSSGGRTHAHTAGRVPDWPGSGWTGPMRRPLMRRDRVLHRQLGQLELGGHRPDLQALRMGGPLPVHVHRVVDQRHHSLQSWRRRSAPRSTPARRPVAVQPSSIARARTSILQPPAPIRPTGRPLSNASQTTADLLIRLGIAGQPDARTPAPLDESSCGSRLVRSTRDRFTGPGRAAIRELRIRQLATAPSQR